MQSDVPHVLATLDRTHDPLRVPAVVGWARQAGFEQVSLDLIYGTPGESLADWETSLDAALACAPDHVSAYSLIVEEGTALARRIARGELPMPDDDDLADKYLLADERARPRPAWAGTRCPTGPATSGRGAGTTSATGPAPTGGASARAPTRTSAACAGGTSSTPRRTPSGSARTSSPAHAREVLDAETRRVERVLLELRLYDGLPVEVLDATGRAAIFDLVARGLIDRVGERLVLTTPGRLLADGVVRDLLP